MNFFRIHQRPSFFISQTTPPLTSLSPPHFLSLPSSPTPREPKPSWFLSSLSAPILTPLPSFSLSTPRLKFGPFRLSKVEAQVWGDEEERNSELEEDLAPDGAVYQKTLRLVECSMFAAVAGLVYLLSNSLAIENYFGCFFALPIVISSLRWGIAAGRKTMVATAILLLVLSGPVKALTYVVGSIANDAEYLSLAAHAWFSWPHYGYFVEVGGKLGCFDLPVRICGVRALGAVGYVLISSFLIRENILALITINIHASLSYIITAVGINSIPSMDQIYAIFGTLLMLNCGFFVFLLHVLYAVLFTRLGMRNSLTLPGWLQRAI